MFIIANLFGALAQVMDVALTILYWLILIRALISWVNPDPFNPIVQFLMRATEPILYPIRRLLPGTANVGGVGLDISPLIAFLLILFFKHFLVNSFVDLSERLK